MSAIEEREKAKTPIEAGPSESTVAEATEADELVTRLSREGWTGGEISRRTGLARSTVYRLRRAQRITGRVSPGRNIAPDEHGRRVARAAELKRQGSTNAEIAGDLRCSTVHVARYLEEADASRPSTRAYGPNGDLAAEKLSQSAACRLLGIDHTMLEAARDADELHPERVESTGLGRNGFVLLYGRGELESWFASLPQCPYPGCDRRVFTGSSGGCRDHHRALAWSGKKHTAATRAKMTASRLGKVCSLETREKLASAQRRWCASPAGRDPALKFKQRIARWGSYGGEYVDRAIETFETALRRRRGGAPRKTELHRRWFGMRNGEDPDLEDLLERTGGEEQAGDRVRLIVLVDWQRHPQDWPRAKWPPDPKDPDSLLEALITGACRRVRAGIKNACKPG